jgi:hypothetical protein
VTFGGRSGVLIWPCAAATSACWAPASRPRAIGRCANHGVNGCSCQLARSGEWRSVSARAARGGSLLPAPATPVVCSTTSPGMRTQGPRSRPPPWRPAPRFPACGHQVLGHPAGSWRRRPRCRPLGRCGPSDAGERGIGRHGVPGRVRLDGPMPGNAALRATPGFANGLRRAPHRDSRTGCAVRHAGVRERVLGDWHHMSALREPISTVRRLGTGGRGPPRPSRHATR